MTLKVGDWLICRGYSATGAYAKIVGETKTQWKCEWSPDGEESAPVAFNVSKRTGTEVKNGARGRYGWGEIGLQCHAEGCQKKARWHVWFVGWPLYDSACDEHMAERAREGAVDGWPISQIALVAESFLPPDDVYWQFKGAYKAEWKDGRKAPVHMACGT